MKTKNLILATIIITIYHGLMNDCFAQSRIILYNNAYMVIDNSAFLVIDSPNANALTTSPAGNGNIKSENELDRIKWNIGATIGIYTIPWTTNSNVKIPLTINKTTAGAGAGSFFTFHLGNYYRHEYSMAFTSYKYEFFNPSSC